MGEFLGMAGIGTLLGGLSAGANAAAIAQQYHYAKQMYKHRYRWAAEDMKKAGFNPILAANGGSVSGMQSVGNPDYAGAIQGGLSSAASLAKAASDIRSQEVSNDKMKADEKLANANADLVASKKVAQDATNLELPRQVRAQAFKAEAEASIANSASVMARARNEYAEQMAYDEANLKHIQAGKTKYDALNSFWKRNLARYEYQTRFSSAVERRLRLLERQAKLFKTESSPWLSILNSASRLVK